MGAATPIALQPDYPDHPANVNITLAEWLFLCSKMSIAALPRRLCFAARPTIPTSIPAHPNGKEGTVRQPQPEPTAPTQPNRPPIAIVDVLASGTDARVKNIRALVFRNREF